MRNTKQRDLLVDYNLNKALTINERIDIYKRNDIPLTSTNYVDKWLSNKSFVKNEEFLTRLETEKITMDEFNLALRELKDIEAEKIVFESLKDSHWYKLYEEVIEHYYENKDIFDKLNITYDIYSPIRVFLFWAESKINLHKGTLENINISNNAVHQMINGIASHCIKVFSKTLIYEFHKNKEEIVCSKANDLKLKIYMKERFTDIENIVAFFNTYPVLLRRLIIKI